MRVRFAFLAVLAVVSGAVLGGLVLGGGVASAEKTIHVDAASVDEVQGSCLQRGGVGMSSMVFLIREEGETRKPDITVTIDTDGNGTADREATVASQAGATDARYVLEERGLVIDAYANVADDWDGTFVMLFDSQCDFDRGAPPADACAEFPGRKVFRLNQALGSPETGRPSRVEIPLFDLDPNVGVGAGTYEVTLQSFDAHSEHGGQGQHHEQWYVSFDDRDRFVDSAPIDDLPDGQDVLNQKVGTITEKSSASHIIVTHVLHSDPNEVNQFTTPESVTAVCVALDPVLESPSD